PERRHHPRPLHSAGFSQRRRDLPIVNRFHAPDPLTACTSQTDPKPWIIMRVRHATALLATLVVLIGPGCTSLPAPSQRVTQPETFAQVADDALAELSGIASSHRTPGVYWVLNDSGDLPRIFALDQTGRTLAEVRLDNATARDWEDIASFTHDGEPWLRIADIGDNGSERTDLRLHLLPEPVLD